MGQGCEKQLVLIIDADHDHALALAHKLGMEGYKTKVALDCQVGLAMVLQDPVPNLVILDPLFPKNMGKEICRVICSHGKTQNIPLLILSSLSTEADRILGFEMGCDDYLVKPYNYRELRCRVKALLRRVSSGVRDNLSLVCGGLRLDVLERQVWIDNSLVFITDVEFYLLQELLVKCGQVQSREALCLNIWGDEKRVSARVVDVTVKRLREKLGCARDYIETVRGRGYRFRCEMAASSVAN